MNYLISEELLKALTELKADETFVENKKKLIQNIIKLNQDYHINRIKFFEEELNKNESNDDQTK